MNRKITKALFVAAILLGGSQVASAQNAKQKAAILAQTNVEELKRLAVEYDAEFKAKKERALKVAAEKGWPVEIKKEDGGTSVLVDVSEEGTPLYLTTTNVGLANTSRVTALQPNGTSGLNLTGDGMIVGVWDGGYARSTHVDLAGKVLAGDSSSGTVALHPTHVTGTIISSGTASSGTKGMAPNANVYMCDYENDLAEMAVLVADGIILSNHSYGLDATQVPSWYFGAYIGLSRQVDVITFNAPFYQPVFSAGNDSNGDFDRLTDRSLAKNGISVAATLQVNNYINAGSVLPAEFSSWGPSDDNRIKPDIATKGVNVRSTSNSSNTATASSNGTSMATPGITGALVLLQEHYSNLNAGNFMRSSTVRGLVAHTADEAGEHAGPDARYGWGLMNATRAAETISKKGTNAGIMDELILQPGQTVTRKFTAAGGEKMIATLAWTDPPGQQNIGVNNQTTPVLVNDLDIVVTKDGETHYPWKLNPTRGQPAVKGVNNVDNIEKVEIDNPAGVYTVTISHKGNTLSNPGGGTPSQAYSLIITGISGEVLSISNADKDFFSLWPNPADNMLNINMASNVEGNASVSLFDVQGRQVVQKSITASESIIDLSGISAGIYMVQVTNGSAVAVKKVIVK